ncbi:MAG: 2-amino-4-hydroxy-6-hydroxymethyldihydropteridine diphosphokinase [Anaerolineae bacterium]|nr:2-amino-4-hydroxy-6-hydroxymethyldihydropteridine diphosphokinase [Anaerolineae bacterium]MCI0608888.1 2-amino-4-hydroxy-6-hydroxymethyldihydropteridine diphosphokinase [Anaerolineae bacterium]
MNELHNAYLNLGSNIQPEMNLVKAIQLLSEYGDVQRVSNAWESRSVGAPGPNFLNACLLFVSPHVQVELREQIIRPIEKRLGRVRSENKYAPRTIDIDIILFDGQQSRDGFWESGFVIVPLAEIYPQYQNPITGENITETATRLRQEVWMEARPEVIGQFSGSNSNV